MLFKPPRGTRDFMPDEMMLMEYVFTTIKSVFIDYGYDPIETPAFEDFQLLEAKCGEEVEVTVWIPDHGDIYY